MPEELQNHGDETQKKEQLPAQDAHDRDGPPEPAAVIVIPAIPDGPPAKGWCPPCLEEPGDPSALVRTERGAVVDEPLLQ